MFYWNKNQILNLQKKSELELFILDLFVGQLKEFSYIWVDQTMNKLGEGRDKQMRFMFQMIELFYMPLMGGNAIIDNIHFKRYLELLNGTTWLSETRTYPKRLTSGQRGGWKFVATYLINNFRQHFRNPFQLLQLQQMSKLFWLPKIREPMRVIKMS